MIDPLEAALSWFLHTQQVVERLEQQEAASRAAERAVVEQVQGPTAEDWLKLRQCESSNDYAINTGNGYYGAYQFDLSTWQSVGGAGYPNQAGPAEQDRRAQLLYDQRGSAPWPVCGQYLG